MALTVRADEATESGGLLARGHELLVERAARRRQIVRVDLVLGERFDAGVEGEAEELERGG